MSKPMNTGYAIKLLLDWAAQPVFQNGFTAEALIFKAMELTSLKGEQWENHWREQLFMVKWNGDKPLCETFFTLSNDGSRYVRNFKKYI